MTEKSSMCGKIVGAVICVMTAVLAESAEKSLFTAENTRIVTGGECTAEFAVKEFNDIVNKSAGYVFKTVGPEDGQWNGKRIFIGRSKEAEKILGKEIFDSFKNEESLVTMRGDDLFLVGGGEVGALWAVYDFCEDNLDYRWYLRRADGERIVKHKVVAFSGKETRKKPAFTGRRCFWAGSRPPEWCKIFGIRNRQRDFIEDFVKDYRFEFKQQVRTHSFWCFLPPHGRPSYVPAKLGIETDNFKKHPEWYSMMKDGKRSDDHQLCLSNPGCRKALTAALLKWIKDNGKGVYMVGENDCRFGRYCYCKDCLALEKKYNTTGGPLWDYMVEVCNEVKKVYPEGVYVTTLAYQGLDQTEKAPDGIKCFPDNFIVDIAYIFMPDRRLKFRPSRIAPEGEEVKYWENTLKWSSLTTHRSYWYYGTFNHAFVYRRMQNELQDLLEADVQSVFACGTGGAYEFSDMTAYLFLKLMQDPNVDIRPEVEAMCRFKYGKAAPAILKYIDGLESSFARACTPDADRIVETDHPYINMGFVSGKELVEWREILDSATPLVADDPSAKEELEFSRIGLDVLTVMYANRIKRECPSVELDYEKIAEDGKATSMRYMEKYRRSPQQKNEALTLLNLAENENAYYGNLKSEKLPPELAGKQAQLVTRILPYKSAQFRHFSRVLDKLTSYPDPDAISGYVIADELNAKQDISKGIKFCIYDTAHRKWMNSGLKSPIPPGTFRKDKFTMYKLGVTTIPSPKCRLVFAETWLSPLAENYLSRAHDPLRPDKKFEIWISAKLDGRRLAIEAIYTVEIL